MALRPAWPVIRKSEPVACDNGKRALGGKVTIYRLAGFLVDLDTEKLLSGSCIAFLRC